GLDDQRKRQLALEPLHLRGARREPGGHRGQPNLGTRGVESLLVQELDDGGHRRLEKEVVLAQLLGTCSKEPGEVVRARVQEMAGLTLPKAEQPIGKAVQVSGVRTGDKAVRVA